MELASKYDPQAVESKWYQYWLDNKLFSSKPDGREPYTVVIPPPNVTGVLHMGHMLNNTIQDILVRRARMEGKNACWVPGTDHASIATEAKVVNRLAQQGIKKTDLTREEFLKHAWDWTHEHGGIILKQLRLRLLGSRFFFLRLCRLRKLSGDAFPERVQQALISRCLRLGGGRRLCLREREKQAFRLFRRFRSVKLLLIRHAKTSHRCDCFYYTPNPMRCPIGTQILHTNFSSVSGAFLKIKSRISRGACS